MCLIALLDKTSFLVLQTTDACCKLGMFIFYLMDGLLLIQLVERDLRYYGEEWKMVIALQTSNIWKMLRYPECSLINY